LIHFYKRFKLFSLLICEDVSLQPHPSKSHWDHPLGAWQFLRGQAPGAGGVKGEDPGADEA